jgi:hypothetical protein
MSTVYLLKAMLPAMRAVGWGRFVHVRSATAKEPEGAIHHVVANGTRPSTIGPLKTVADEYAQYGVTVNTLAPGWIETQNAIAYLDRQAGLASPEERGRWMKDHARVPAARMGRQEEIASMIVYLCSELRLPARGLRPAVARGGRAPNRQGRAGRRGRRRRRPRGRLPPPPPRQLGSACAPGQSGERWASAARSLLTWEISPPMRVNSAATASSAFSRCSGTSAGA